MARFAIAIPLIMSLGSAFTTQDSATSTRFPGLTLTIPAGIPSEAVQIRYFMVGPFGGYGNFVKPAKNQSAYHLPMTVDGQSATSVKVIAYMPGCEIIKLEIPIAQANLARPLPCTLLPNTLLRGLISPASTVHEHEHAIVEVTYLADWDHRFFGIADGMVTSISLGTVTLDARGQFEISIPDFGLQSNLGEAELHLMLRDAATGNIIASLLPSTEAPGAPAVRVRTSYPAIIEFLAKEPSH